MNKHWDDTMVQAEPPAPMDDAGVTRRPGDDTTAGELHFRELVNVLRRRSRLILATTLCGTMLAFALGLSIPPKYTAKAEITIYTGDSPTAAPTRDETVIETHINMLFSRDYLQHVLDDLQGTVDLGAVATEFVILGIDPYPRKAGVVFRAPATADERTSPFAPLAALKKRTGKGED